MNSSIASQYDSFSCANNPQPDIYLQIVLRTKISIDWATGVRVFEVVCQ